MPRDMGGDAVSAQYTPGPMHTKGPWVVGTDTSRDAAPGRVHILALRPGGTAVRVAVAQWADDAPLLAAAPAMLSALLAVIKNAEDNYDGADDAKHRAYLRIEHRTLELVRASLAGLDGMPP